jgi:hypothetical protein
MPLPPLLPPLLLTPQLLLRWLLPRPLLLLLRMQLQTLRSSKLH